ncbi:MAG: hypothetical protein AAFY38_03775 [Pseudomonadota bacterium]
MRFRAACLAVLTAGQAAAFEPNQFAFFDYILTPMAITWGCGADPVADIKRLTTLAEAFTEDAQQADLMPSVQLLAEVMQRPDGLAQLLGAQLTSEQSAQLCDAAAPLRFDWLTPEALNDPSFEAPADVRLAFKRFFEAAEAIEP